MPEIEIRDKANAVTGKVSLSGRVFGSEGNTSLMHTAVVNYLANQRQGTHAVKTKGLVSGGGRKPFKQKHTGRARAGSIRSPLWKGGGTVFGPQPRDYSYSIPKKERISALCSALSMKLSDGEIIVVDGFKLEAPKTKDMVSILKNLEVGGKSLLVVMAEPNGNLMASVRNIPRVAVKLADDINVYDVLSHERLILTKDAVTRLEARL